MSAFSVSEQGKELKAKFKFKKKKSASTVWLGTNLV